MWEKKSPQSTDFIMCFIWVVTHIQAVLAGKELSFLQGYSGPLRYSIINLTPIVVSVHMWNIRFHKAWGKVRRRQIKVREGGREKKKRLYWLCIELLWLCWCNGVTHNYLKNVKIRTLQTTLSILLNVLQTNKERKKKDEKECPGSRLSLGRQC